MWDENVVANCASHGLHSPISDAGNWHRQGGPMTDPFISDAYFAGDGQLTGGDGIMLVPMNGSDDDGKADWCDACCDKCEPVAHVSKVVAENGGGAVACRVA